MKKAFTFLLFSLLGSTQAQIVADLESFVLPADSFYYNAVSADFQTTNAVYQYDWNTSFGGYWSGGIAYTNKNNVDSGNYRHLYNCIAGKGYSNSNYYATSQNNSIIKLKTATANVVNGFYITNSTYAYKSMKNGDAFAKKFGGVSGNDPDWFKLTVKGFYGGAMKTDSAVFYLADFRFNNNSMDYIVQNWQWFNCSNLGLVDSIQFFMYSSDTGMWGMNTPGFFSFDDFTTTMSVGIKEINSISNIQLFPNPANDLVNIKFENASGLKRNLKLYNSLGATIKEENLVPTNEPFQLDLTGLESGLYLLEINSDNNKQSFKLVKQ